ncbi:hypothetical protein DM01DRAFT_1369885 [Hesseltinella vesiculosa]|uniref:Uncharacterized protein n=1 Tax=Hesseltinella vesiculosa TaxID=101127 RepID=A0A1X2GV95_9FUNG|nr:hypothetical protein DM01DRAFT_1369885 [Hesseltinella vesiculosa]
MLSLKLMLWSKLSPSSLVTLQLRQRQCQRLFKFMQNRLVEKLGDYVESDEALLAALNSDFRIEPHLLQAMAELHTGAIVLDKEVNLALVCEAYARSKSIDIHAESLNLSLPPTNISSAYPSTLTAGVFDEADGHGTKPKLKVARATRNVFVTMAAPLLRDRQVDVGPSSSPLTLRPSKTRAFYQKNKVGIVLAHVHGRSPLSPLPTISSLRQLTSSFNDPSTFMPWRTSLDCLNNDHQLPATVFTLCDLPHNQGYGTANLSPENLASRLLQAAARAFLDRSKRLDFSTPLHLIKALLKERAEKSLPSTKDGSMPAGVAEMLGGLAADELSCPEYVMIETLSLPSDQVRTQRSRRL